MKLKYSVYTNYLKRLPTHDLEKAGEIRNFVVQNIPLDSAKQFLVRLSGLLQLGDQIRFHFLEPI